MNPERRRRRQIWSAGICAGLACVVIIWSLTLWPGAALIGGAVTGPVIALLYSVAYDFIARRP